ncbi:hypothetical protein [Synechococcus sp. EJ6-Ellesmere]|uniref:hypothetical protein n=1 Tax=Synechococcus sp. EJ6-Ellesmere TaxID=2823734 RepID=UPI0020CCBC26|nr:hypothetical protein [Synechococcus sp. EJ6-Ellesmere]MCP9826347.1 hypothetical protein [Synechococcus sp. EJ6-Ellesmere]
MARDFDLSDSRGRERMVRDVARLLRKLRPDLMAGEHLYRSPAGFGSWAEHWAKAVAVELAQEESESRRDHVGIWGAMVCRWARELGAEPRFLSPSLAQAFLQTERPLLTPSLPRDVRCFRLFLPKATLFGEEGPEIRSVLVADVRAMEGWLPENVQLAGGGLACVGLGEDGATYLASCLLDPAAKAQQPEHTDFSAPHWEWDDDGVKGTAARMEQLCVHALLAQLYVPELVQEGEVPPAAGAKGFGGQSAAEGVQLQRPVWLGKDYQLQRQPTERPDMPAGTWKRGHWRALSPLDNPMAAPLGWGEPMAVQP